jgi:hypothetical protein
MTTTHDTSRTIEIEGSPAKLILLSVLGLVMTGASLFVVLYPPLRTDIMAQIVGYFGTLFFGLCTLIGFVRLVRAGRPVVTISPRGIQDVRVASETIPWAADQEHLDLERARATALDGARGRRRRCDKDADADHDLRAGPAAPTPCSARMGCASRRRGCGSATPRCCRPPRAYAQAPWRDRLRAISSRRRGAPRTVACVRRNHGILRHSSVSLRALSALRCVTKPLKTRNDNLHL